MQFLIKSSAVLNKKDIWFHRAYFLTGAVFNNDLKIAKLLMISAADVNLQNNHGRAVQYETYASSIEMMVSSPVKNSTNINAVDSDAKLLFLF